MKPSFRNSRIEKKNQFNLVLVDLKIAQNNSRLMHIIYVDPLIVELENGKKNIKIIFQLLTFEI